MLATQMLLAKKAKNMLVQVDGTLAARRAPPRTSCWPSSASIGTAGGTGYTIEFAGSRDPRAVDGRPHDGLQHGDRGRRARRHGRGGRHDDRLRARAARSRRRGVEWDQAVALLAHAAVATPARSSTRWSSSTRRRSSRRSPGARRPRWCCRSTTACPIPTSEKDADQARARSSARWPTWAWSRTRRSTDIAHRQGVHRLVHQLAHRGPARGRRRRAPLGQQRGAERQAGDGRAGLGPGEGAGRARRPATRSSRPPASSGASRAARCAWR